MKKRKDWKTGDTFALEIKNSKYKEYNGKYLLFIYVDYPKELVQPSKPVFRAKITKDSSIPSTIEEIEKLDYIIVSVDTIEMKFNLETDPEKANKLLQLQDEWGYLNAYQFSVWTSYKRKIPDDMKYIGNFQITPPVKEFVPHHLNIHLQLWSDIEDELTDGYYCYSLRQCELYTKEVSEKWHKQEGMIWTEVGQYLKDIQDGKIQYDENGNRIDTNME